MSAAKTMTALEALSEHIPDSQIKHRTQGGADIPYIEWHTAADLLDERAPGWGSEIKEVGSIGERVYVRLAITIDGITRENIGYEDESNKGYGDPFSNAFAMAFKRAAALFGLGRHLYDKDARRGKGRSESQVGRQQQQPRPAPAKQSSGSGVTESQLRAITNIGKAKRIDVGVACAEMYQLAPEQLSTSQASEFITWLQGN